MNEVTTLKSNTSYLAIDVNGKNGQSIVDSYVTAVGNNPSKISIKGFRKLAFTYINYSNIIPNINPRNNTIGFNYNGNPFTATMTTGYYSTTSEVLDEVVSAMNTACGGAITHPGTLIGSFDAGAGNKIEFTSATKQRWLYNPELLGGGTQTKKYGPVYRTYTRYMDIYSDALTENALIRNASVDAGTSNIIQRIWLNNSIPFGDTYDFEINNATWLNRREDLELSLIDIRFIDEYNELLYLPEKIGPYNEEPMFIGIQFSLEL